MDYDSSIKEAKEKIKEHAYYMKMALDAQNLKDAMKKAKLMLSQLRVDDVSPRDYYMLFMEVFDELQLLEEAFRDEQERKKMKFSKIYEKVQYSDEIIPRLYLMITAGSVLMDTEERTAHSVISDLTGMLKGVQHPFRGLFLRYYFLKMVKDKIPDGQDEESTQILVTQFGSLDNIISMLLENLTEMNKLWIRINSLIKDKKRRKKERGDLKVTVGENIVRLSGIESVTLEIYKEKVLPPLLEHITETNDRISQQYLMDCIIHAFPDEYHISTLELFLKATENLHKKVDLRLIYIKLMERFAEYSKNYDEEDDDNSIGNISDMHFIYDKFKTSIRNIIDKLEADNKFKLEKLLELLAAFINFCVHTYPDKIEYVDQILELAVVLCSKVNNAEFNDKELNSIVSILSYPLETMSIVVLNLSKYPSLMNLLPFERRKTVAVRIVEAVLSTNTYLITESISTRFIAFIEPLLVLQADAVKIKARVLEQEQTLIARLIHYFCSHDPNITYKMLKMLEGNFTEGPVEWKRFTIPSLITNYCRLIQKSLQIQKVLKSEDGNIEETIQFYDKRNQAPYLTEEEKAAFSLKVEGITFDLGELFDGMFILIEDFSLDYPSVGISLYLDLSAVVCSADTETKEFDELQYDICSEALELYQDEISDTKEKKFHLEYIIGSFMSTTNLSPENLEMLFRNTTTYASCMLKKHNKVSMLCKATHLYHSDACKDDQRILEIFKKALKFANHSIRRKPNTAYVYINILDKLIYYYNMGVETIGKNEINGCIKHLKENMTKVTAEVRDMMQLSLDRITSYLHQKQKDNQEKFGGIDI